MNKCPIENVKELKYLGNIITSTGNFQQNDKYLKLKGLRSSYQIMKILGMHMKPSKSIKLFEKIVEPILLYNCEITAAYLPHKWNFHKFKLNIWSIIMEVDKVLKNYIPQILGVDKKCLQIEF